MLLRLALVIGTLTTTSRRASTANRVTCIDKGALAHIETLWLTVHANRIAILTHEGIWIDLLLDLLLFLLALKVLGKAYGFLVHEACPDAWLNRLHLSICAVMAAKVIWWLVEVHACGVRVWWIEGIG